VPGVHVHVNARGRELALLTPAAGIITRTALHDSVFLVIVVVLSCLPYLWGLGLYSDDWALLSELHNAGGSFRRMWDALAPMGITTRPVQGLVLMVLYALFELEPLGYHIVNTAVLAAAVVLFYLSLRVLGLSRTIAVVVPVVFALLPHYSTDRFWIAAFQANVSVFLYFLSLYADLRFVTGAAARRWLWKALGTIAMVGSVLAYEVTALLFPLNVLALWYVARGRRHESFLPRPGRSVLGAASNVLFLGLAVGYKLTTTERADVSGGYGWRALRIVREAVPVHFGEFGLALPVKVVRVLRDDPNALILAVSVLVGLAVCAYLLLVVRPTQARFDRHVSWLAVLLAGVILFVAGYGVSLTTYEIGFHTTGTNNRTAIGPAIGVSWVLAGAIGWITSRLPSERLRWSFFSGLVALLAASNTLLTNTVAEFWLSAFRKQETVIAAIRQQFPELPSRSTLLVDGLCPFEGPAVVFATNWDVTGMLQLVYDERSLQGDVVKPNSEVTAAGIRTQLFDDVIHVYPYGDRLVVYHLGLGEAFPLTSLETARRYFEDVSASARAACPPYTDGDGVRVF
jgi:hypothetical protein